MKHLALALASLALFSCALQGTHPQGFAPYAQGMGAKEHRAVSPEGVTWRVHRTEHKPKADLAFWKAATRKRMQEAGYHIVDSLSFQSKGQAGFAWELGAPLGQSDYTYLVGAVPTSQCIWVIEAAGKVEDYSKHRSQIHLALQELELR